jgi:hypothetical protein
LSGEIKHVLTLQNGQSNNGQVPGNDSLTRISTYWK